MYLSKYFICLNKYSPKEREKNPEIFINLILVVNICVKMRWYNLTQIHMFLRAIIQQAIVFFILNTKFTQKKGLVILSDAVDLMC